MREEAIKHLQSDREYVEATRKRKLDEEMTSAFRRMQLATEWEAELDLQSQPSPDMHQQEPSKSALAFESHEFGPTDNISMRAHNVSKDEFSFYDTGFAAEAPEIEEAFPAEDDATLQLFRVLAAEGRESQALRGEQAPCEEAQDRLASAEFTERTRLLKEGKE